MIIYSLWHEHLFFSLSLSPSDDRSSAASGLDVADRLTYLEQRMQMQEDEIQMLKMALADVLKRLNISEEHQAAAAASASRRSSGAKCEQNSADRHELLSLSPCQCLQQLLAYRPLLHVRG